MCSENWNDASYWQSHSVLLRHQSRTVMRSRMKIVCWIFYRWRISQRFEVAVMTHNIHQPDVSVQNVTFFFNAQLASRWDIKRAERCDWCARDGTWPRLWTAYCASLPAHIRYALNQIFLLWIAQNNKSRQTKNRLFVVCVYCLEITSRVKMSHTNAFELQTYSLHMP